MIIKVSEFSNTAIDYEKPHGEDKWVLLEEVKYNSVYLQRQIIVLENFKTDFASIPRPIRWLFDNDGSYKDAALLHDWLYNVQPEWCTRYMADKILFEASYLTKTALWVRWALFIGVRVGGWVPWNNNKRELQNAR